MKVSKILKQFSLMAGLAVGLFWMSGCLEEIDFAKADAIDEALAIQGKIVKGSPSFVSVTIRGVFNFEDVPRLLDARDVFVEDESGNKVELKTNASGVFFVEIPDNHPTFKVDYGKSYKITVSTFDNRNYSSGFDELYPAPVPGELKVEKTQIETSDVNGNVKLFDQLTYSIHTPLKPASSSENARLLWELVTTYKFTDTPNSYGQRACWPTRIDDESKTCYLTASPVNNYVTLNGPDLSVDAVEDHELLNSSISSIYSEGLYLTVIQQSLSPAAYAYWSQVGNVVNRSGDLFQAPAGKVITNITNVDDAKEDVFGYFYATEESTRRLFINPAIADNPPLPCPSPPSESGQAANDCCDCETAGDASLIKPSWWIN